MKNTLIMLLFFSISALSWADIQPGQPAPDFLLTDFQSKTQQLSAYKGSFVVLEWFNKDCPFVQKHYKSNNMQKLQRLYSSRKVIWLTINSSAPGKQGHENANQTQQTIKELGATPTTVLLDPEGKVGKLYGAKTTPHIFIIGPDQKVIYAGAIDDKPSYDMADVKTARNFVSETLEAALAGKAIKLNSHRAYGCAIKY